MTQNRPQAMGRPHGNSLSSALPETLRAFVSHELRAPLTCVDGALKLVTSDEVKLEQEQITELIALAKSSTQRLVKLLDKLLDDPGTPCLPAVSSPTRTRGSGALEPSKAQLSHSQVLRVLMVEDDYDYFRFVRQVLEGSAGSRCHVEHAADIESMNAHLRRHPVGVILLDLFLPDSDGLDTVRRVRGLCPRAPIVVLTGLSDQELGLHAVAQGADDYLVKHHVTNDSLLRCIKYAVTRKTCEESTMRLAAIGDFTHALAHDLTVPLTGARNVLQALSRQTFGPLTPEQEQVICTLNRSNEEQLQLLQKLLEVYSYDLMPPDIPFEPLNLQAIIAEVIAQLAESQSGLKRIANQLSADMAFVKGNRQALVRLFFNIIENALRYSDPDSAIRISGWQDSETLSISVQNWGKPMPPEVISGMFDRFWRGIPGKTYVTRSGVGLYLAQRIVSLHGGRIICQSDEDQGTNMTVQLPVTHS